MVDDSAAPRLHLLAGSGLSPLYLAGLEPQLWGIPSLSEGQSPCFQPDLHVVYELIKMYRFEPWLALPR